MNDPAAEELLDRLLAPRTIDPHQVALILQPSAPRSARDALVALVTELAARDGYFCASQVATSGQEEADVYPPLHGT